jgi:serine/threonine protein kinase
VKLYMRKIQLVNNEWYFDESRQIGPSGGFGTVFSGIDSDGTKVAVKRLHIDAAQAAHRELDIADFFLGKKYKHIIPILDAGQDANSNDYFVVMPVAERSLQDLIDKQGPVNEQEAINIGLQVVRGLIEAKELVHRDLKPGNILFHQNSWKIADFGIAKFVADSTSTETLRGFRSRQYAAPEQWKEERPSHKTDVYALGCVFHALLTGSPPFLGPDLRRQHLEEKPPVIPNIHPGFSTRISMMLRKSEGGRPDLQRVESLLSNQVDEVQRDADPSALSLAARKIAEAQAVEEVEKERELQLIAQREQLASQGLEIFDELFQDLYKRLADEAPMIEGLIAKGSPIKQIRLGTAIMEASLLYTGKPVPLDAFAYSDWNVILGATLKLYQKTPKYVWGANLWYADLAAGSENYRWWETAYMTTGKAASFQPIALDKFKQADIAASNIAGAFQFAYDPRPIDDEEFEGFYKRWSEWLAKASGGKLEYPRYLPLNI